MILFQISRDVKAASASTTHHPHSQEPAVKKVFTSSPFLKLPTLPPFKAFWFLIGTALITTFLTVLVLTLSSANKFRSFSLRSLTSRYKQVVQGQTTPLPSSLIIEESDYEPIATSEMWSSTSLMQQLSQNKAISHTKLSKYSPTLKPLLGHHRCNRYGRLEEPRILIPDGFPNVYSTDTYMASCKFENLCMTSSGEFVLFEPSQRITGGDRFAQILNSRPWVYTQGSTVHSDRGNFFGAIVDGDLVLQMNKEEESQVENAFVKKTRQVSCQGLLMAWNGTRHGVAISDDVENSERSTAFENSKIIEEIRARVGKDPNALCHENYYAPIALSKDFQIIEKPIYALKRYAAGNAGHFLSQSLGMIMGLMMNFQSESVGSATSAAFTSSSSSSQWQDNHILYLDDLESKEGFDWMGLFGYDLELGNKFSLTGGQLLSQNPILQRCFVGGRWRVMPAPCRNDSLSIPTTSPASSNRMELQTCFTNFFAGHTTNNLVIYPYGKEYTYMKIRELTYKNLRILPFDGTFTTTQQKQRLEAFLKKKDILISINRKEMSDRHLQAIFNVDQLADYLRKHLPQDPFIQELLTNKDGSKRKLIIEDIDLYKFPSIPSQVRYFSDVDIYISDPGSAAYYSMFLRDETTVILPPTCENPSKCKTSHGVHVLQALPNIQIADLLELNNGIPPPCIPRPGVLSQINCDVVFPPDLVLKSIVRAFKKRFTKYLTRKDLVL
ncbi:hypothetical protein FDP41_011710 [Naegleria fowleri]|uniref:Uncharacterized protein n=1 Tax=Naegleria fowleri TaxID=5763 RepID=A0A6A5C985_NAEFO|nr:uncharacterized protein FDP41_011710 [Naegleria fowleri]KAF0981849.1 hypothetical protein FDP41_011710 [Naegleria fowleri]CAG4714684.1 unnamed protein product [Naegleria fowleri]